MFDKLINDIFLWILLFIRMSIIPFIIFLLPVAEIWDI